jgi:hypothetical protein
VHTFFHFVCFKLSVFGFTVAFVVVFVAFVSFVSFVAFVTGFFFFYGAFTALFARVMEWVVTLGMVLLFVVRITHTVAVYA